MKRATFNGLVAGGFLAVAIGILVARANPATSYEPSIYAATPTLTWIGFGIALAVAVSTALVCRGREQALGIALGGTTVTAIVSLPVIRNYRFIGMGDGLSHLGWTRDIVEGQMAPHELFYPAVHTIASVFHYVGGIPIERGLLFSVVILFVPFLIFVPLIVREIDGDGLAIGIAAIVSWMVLPINNVATHMGVHTNSNALFLVPVVVFAFVAYLRRRATIERLPLGLSPFSLLIYLTGLGLLLVHPQHMIGVIVLIGSIAGIQYLARRRYDDHPMLDHPTMYAHTVVLGAIFTLWAASNERFRDAFAGLIIGVFEEDIGGGAEVGQRESSLQEIGGSIVELFVTMFLELAIVALVVGVFVLLVWLGRTALDPETKSQINYLSLSLFPLTGLFVVYFVGTPTMAFRQVGFIAVLLTVLAGIALARGIDALSGVITRPGASAVAALLLGGCLVLGLMTVFASPIIYNPGQHVTDETFSGYDSALDHSSEDTPLVGMGHNPYRYDHGLNGLEGEGTLSAGSASTGTVDPETFEAGDYEEAYRGIDYNFIVTEYDLTRELEVYQELHYSDESLEDFETDSSANKVISNDEFRMYTVDGADDPE
ncbi:hypothetical protein HTZ84_21320 [Haloterrigena sp. SYSU A558-1]|uniref:Uncharacterized protein n=1 Tax=Haloterrigena gelatinilytica TaxID=2741724 RepID=A0A8J8KGX1_9EURY|nr:hypothetical protein [Haloterrigena gelatinilytica]NUB93883.1 hypothetical protein [Haloterrigena gelatinilytica]NUC74807.1 hypothetical protein [Haloterrigena gelatinilytica]